ncbi:glycerol kinase [Saccharobesus litoralis]|uniref:glycerol kinase n=1 Tax=Saccharobesus litoralis TaxID=2172099 RepID=A0A2S0VNY7_9ALTE|nr:glycerol kinase GlpK [Saccharobesus litoralis]AWB65935.1 glycerol kinase [Saccharobesus litoralis]
MTQYLIAIDQGTTSSRAILFHENGQIECTAQQEFEQIYPENAWVEHDPTAILSSVLSVLQQVVSYAQQNNLSVAGIGITNQRETTIVWDKTTGKPVYNAIVWQDRRTSDYCQQLKKQGLEQQVSSKTGLLIDPYFSATKIRWILDNVAGAKLRAQQGELAFGTVDTFLLWHLTGGREFKTDASNASRTMLFNIHQQAWDADLLSLFDIPVSMLPQVCDCAAHFGHTDRQQIGDSIAILAMAGDQQAAMIGQACLQPGAVKTTYGTGAFLMLNTGNQAVQSQHKLLTTVAYRLNGKVTYALEGSIFVAGAAIQWLRDKLQIIDSAEQTSQLAQSLPLDHGVYTVPAFTGLGAPYWDPDVRGMICGLTRDSGNAALVSSALQSVAFQTLDLLNAMQADKANVQILKVDGGMTANTWLLQFIADICQCRVMRPVILETTALGVALLAGLQAGVYANLEQISQQCLMDVDFSPAMDPQLRASLISRWQLAVQLASQFK